ncbi:MAG: hypothetical protein J5982_00290 [Bacilli bacterium]|nr:hypothetical protein [Bacilli bacterium]
MSFIVAKKYKNKIKVMADDKLYVSPNDEQMLIREIGNKNYRDICCLGIIKNVIIDKNICVCSAGVLEDFNLLLKEIDDKNITDLKKICDISLKINIEKNNRTDFIVCSVKENNIYEIKDNKINNVDSSWIGVYKCFEEFQKLRLSDEIRNYSENVCELITGDEKKDLVEEIIDSESFKRVLKLNIDETVGEKVIECIGKETEFLYQSYYSATISKPKQLETNSSMINFDDSVFDGGYSFLVEESNSNYKMYIYQIGCLVEYCAHLNNDNYSHLRLPKMIYDNET